MAFPTTSLTNNQVHKEGNRAFVYDSTLGTWDQVREEDEGKKEDIIMSGEISPNVTFPAGHVIQTKMSTVAGYATTQTQTNWTNDHNITVRGKFEMSCTAGNTLMTQLWMGGWSLQDVSQDHTIWARLGIGTSDPGSTAGDDYTYLGNNIYSGSMRYYSTNGQSNQRWHGASWQNILQPTVTGTYHLFFITAVGFAGDTAHFGINTSPMYMAQEIQGDCLV
jgi:hypothetical protein